MSPLRVVHLELHTDDLGAAGAFYYELSPWRAEQIDSPRGSYHALLLGDGLGIAACGTRRAGWQPAFGASEGQVGPIAKPGHPAPQKSCGQPAALPPRCTPFWGCWLARRSSPSHRCLLAVRRNPPVKRGFGTATR
jgi:hypothetical protein